ncbi:MAG: DUF3179 domain-containing protein [Microcoleaceae cyanobacterium]
MKTLTRLTLGSLTIIPLLFLSAIVHAGGWDNFKLRYFHLTQHLHDQNQEIRDISQRNINPAENSRIDLKELLNGGPPKDCIPSIDRPQFDTAATTPFGPDETVVGIVVNGEAKAYPYGIMNWHEIVNDRLGGMNLTISYCPLCDTIVAFDRGNTTYGVSGKLYQSCLVMYDRADDTLYAQPWSLGVVGPQVNRSLDRIPAVKTTLGAWLKQHPDSQILSTNTGYNRDYQRYPYGTYSQDSRIIFPVRNQQQRSLEPKAIVTYIWETDGETPHNHFSGSSLEFSHAEMQSVGEKTVNFNGRTIRVFWDEDLQTVRIEEQDGTPVPSSTAFAFVYPAFMGE